MQLLNSTGMGTPMDYMYQNQYYGGAGYIPPAPQFYNISSEGYNPNVNMQQMYDPYTPTIGNIRDATVIGNKAYEDDITIPSGIANSPTMRQQFAYQQNPYYQNYNTGSYYQNYGATQYHFNNFGNPYAYHEDGFYNPYLSKPLCDNMVNDYISRNPNSKSMFTTGYSGYNGFFRAAEIQKEAQLQYERHMETYSMLCCLNSKWFNLGPDDTVEARQKYYEEVEKRQKEFTDYQRELNMYCYVNGLFTMVDQQQTQGVYESPARKRYIESWNKMYTERASKYPQNYTMYEFFNNGIAENMYMDTIIDLAKMRDRELNQLYNRDAFRQTMSVIHPGFNPSNDPASFASARLPLTLDDMEITLPESLRNTEEFKRKEKFISSIMKNMVV